MRKIEDYALLGDLQTAALVHRNGSVDWCCFPRFDSDACFAALLGGPEHGRWLLAPATEVRQHERRYRQDTLILESIFETAEGRVRAIDFMPPRGAAPDIVRIVEGLDGAVPMRSELVIRFDYGRIVPWVRRIDGTRLAVAGPDALAFRTPVDVHGEDLSTVSEFTLEPGDRVPFVLTWYPSHEQPPAEVDAEQALIDTEEYWLDWAGSGTHQGDYHIEIRQSLLVLKSLTYAPTGGIVAAPTTSLPEVLGGARNWDYRFCWLRDASLTLVAMLKGGYRDEAQAWQEWLLRAVAGDPADVQIMYGLAGERRLDELELDWLPGFGESQPVRVGNAASTQLQLDVFGELLDASHQAAAHGIVPSRFAAELLRTLLEWLEDGWRQKDAGLWEVRGSARHFTHSKVMSWVAFDRAVRMHDEFGLEGPLGRWRELREEIHAEVLANAWSERKQAFVQAYGSEELDSAVLLMPLVGFLPVSDPRVASTVDAIRQELSVDGLLLRYRPDASAVDGIAGGEATFLACSFWLVRVLELQGRHDEARELFERLLDLRNDVGLLAEQYDPIAGHQLGNFPQAFTHLGLVRAALSLVEGRAPASEEPRGRVAAMPRGSSA
jgi:GH15 family glucan-1,4-alpha-glucosidase